MIDSELYEEDDMSVSQNQLDSQLNEGELEEEDSQDIDDGEKSKALQSLIIETNSHLHTHSSVIL
jgi:ferredoxin